LREETLLEDDFNEYFQRPMLSHPRLSSAALEEELETAIQLMWTWPNVLSRLAGALFGIGRRRTSTPWIYFKRQVSHKIMISTGLRTYGEGGLFRRRGAADARRLAVTDEDARRVYLGDSATHTFPAPMRDDSSMESLPVLSQNLLPGDVRLSA
jgi:hypothetical protein